MKTSALSQAFLLLVVFAFAASLGASTSFTNKLSLPTHETSIEPSFENPMEGKKPLPIFEGEVFASLCLFVCAILALPRFVTVRSIHRDFFVSLKRALPPHLISLPPPARA